MEFTKMTDEQSAPSIQYDADIVFSFKDGKMYCAVNLRSEDAVIYVTEFIENNPSLLDNLIAGLLANGYEEEADFIEELIDQPEIPPSKVFYTKD